MFLFRYGASSAVSCSEAPKGRPQSSPGLAQQRATLGKIPKRLQAVSLRKGSVVKKRSYAIAELSAMAMPYRRPSACFVLRFTQGYALLR